MIFHWEVRKAKGSQIQHFSCVRCQGMLIHYKTISTYKQDIKLQEEFLHPINCIYENNEKNNSWDLTGKKRNVLQ